MKNEFSRLAVRLGAVLLLFFFHVGPAGAAEKSVTGVVLESGFSGLVLQVPGKGAGVKYNTGRETVFTPEDYTPGKGDTVRIEYFRKQLVNGDEVLAVSALTLVKMAPGRKELTSPAVGRITEIGRKNIRFEFPATGQQLSMEPKRGMERVPGGWEPAVGNKVRVHYDKVRSRFGSGIVYVMTKMEKVD